MQGVQKSIQLVHTATVPYGVGHLLDIWSWASKTSFGTFGDFCSRLIPFGSHSFLFGRHPLQFESLFGFQLGLVLEEYLKRKPVLSRHLYTILVSNLLTNITKIIVNRVIIVSLTFKVVLSLTS